MIFHSLLGLIYLPIYYRKKKNKKKKDHTKNIEVPREVEDGSEMTSKPKDKRTPAQIAFDRVQEKRVECISMQL